MHYYYVKRRNESTKLSLEHVSKSDLSQEVIKLFKVIPGTVAIPYERCLHCKCITYSFCLLISVGLASLC